MSLLHHFSTPLSRVSNRSSHIKWHVRQYFSSPGLETIHPFEAEELMIAESSSVSNSSVSASTHSDSASSSSRSSSWFCFSGNVSQVQRNAESGNVDFMSHSRGRREWYHTYEVTPNNNREEQ
mmetsp:Transcript_6133/g.23186  ORF Transcript_6133/g.23186 Transcript_6133/m.23186 type:complete len:123 (+) Transcript_6133:505-873(+)